MKKLWNDWSGPVAFTLGWTLLLAAALLMPNVPVWAESSEARCPTNCKRCGSPEMVNGKLSCMGQGGQQPTCKPAGVVDCDPCRPCHATFAVSTVPPYIFYYCACILGL